MLIARTEYDNIFVNHQVKNMSFLIVENVKYSY